MQNEKSYIQMSNEELLSEMKKIDKRIERLKNEKRQTEEILKQKYTCNDWLYLRYLEKQLKSSEEKRIEIGILLELNNEND